MIYFKKYEDLIPHNTLNRKILQKDFLLDIVTRQRPSSSNRLIVSNDKIHFRKRFVLKTLEQPKKVKNYCIQGEYYNELEWIQTNILIDTGLGSSYISKELILILDFKDLPRIKKYTNFDGKEFIVTKSYNTIIRLSNVEIELPLLVQEEENEISIMLRMTFLEKGKPWKITS